MVQPRGRASKEKHHAQHYAGMLHVRAPSFRCSFHCRSTFTPQHNTTPPFWGSLPPSLAHSFPSCLPLTGPDPGTGPHRHDEVSCAAERHTRLHHIRVGVVVCRGAFRSPRDRVSRHLCCCGLELASREREQQARLHRHKRAVASRHLAAQKHSLCRIPRQQYQPVS